MTIKELYDWAKKKGYENFKLVDCYGYDDVFNPNDDFIHKKDSEGKNILVVSDNDYY